MDSTIGDFWRLCYQENVSTIIMLCGFEEGGKQKCAQYFPTAQGAYNTYGPMFVSNKKVRFLL